MTIEEMKAKKIELGYTNQTLSEKSGVPLGTIQKIFAGFTRAPREETIKALEKVLSGNGKKGGVPYKIGEDLNLKFGERPIEYGKPGYTLKDYLALPDDQRVELIDGVFYDMAAPTTIHQAIGGAIYKFLLDHVWEHGGACMPLISPVDVQLDCDDKTVVQPDVMIVCDRSKFQNGRVFGAPDMLVEVLSPSTRKKDMQLKAYKYANAGVREYWMVDTKKKVIIVYDFEHEDIPTIYSFEDKVPVLIWDKKCEVDFALIYEKTGFLFE